MKEREVTDQENTQWKCIQAFSGLEGEAAAKAEQKPPMKKAKCW